jgi:EAL domain-containing protein (putative c-di-GMP-specific phosphodiesterase class I)
MSTQVRTAGFRPPVRRPEGRQWLIRRCIAFAPKAASCAILVGLLVLLGYGFGAPQIGLPLKQGPSTNPWTAFCLIILGLATIVAPLRRPSNASAILSALAATIAVARITFVLTELATGVLTLPFFARVMTPDMIGGVHINAMAVQTAVMILLLALALLLLRARRSGATQIVAALAALPPGVALLGYIYGVPGFHGTMALPSVFGGLFCSLAILLRTAHRSPLRDFLAMGAGGRLVRFQTLALVSPCLLLGLFAARSGFDLSPKTLPILVTIMVLVIVCVLWDATYHSSRMGRWRPAPQRDNIRDHPLVRALDGAWDRGEIFVVYQPQIDLATDKVIGVEALARWNHPEHGLVSPADFIPLAEEAGLIVPLGAWVLRKACEDAMTWQDSPFADIAVSVNVSFLQLDQVGFPELVMNILGATGLAAQRLIVEVTEGIMVKKGTRGLEALHDLNAKNVHVAIDDFGTGYSSLSYLRLLPSDYLKIDQSFVRELPNDEGAAAIARAIVAIGRSLGMRVVAEGIETEEQADFLQSIWCDEGQGYFYARPMTATDVRIWAEARAWRSPNAIGTTLESSNAHG